MLNRSPEIELGWRRVSVSNTLGIAISGVVSRIAARNAAMATPGSVGASHEQRHTR